MAIPVPAFVRAFARDDIKTAIAHVNEDLGQNLVLNDLTFETEESEDDLEVSGGDYSSAISVTATAELHYGDRFEDTIMYQWEYFIGDDDVYFSGIPDMVDGIKAELDANVNSSITAATSVTAADGFEDDSENNFDDQLDDMADNIDDMQDTLDEVTEDDPSIQVDNNITDHYIAECEKCHGVFISAVTESDQEVQSVTGVCPVCGKESEQLLKWIVRDANEGAFDDLVIDEEAL